MCLELNRIHAYDKLGFHNAICLTNSFVFTLGDCVKFKAARYDGTSLTESVGVKC